MTDLLTLLKGGRGSGDWGHVGRAGRRGGSGGGGGKGKPRRGRRSREALDKEIERNKKKKKNTIDKQVMQKSPRKTEEYKILLATMEDNLTGGIPMSVAQRIGKDTGVHFRDVGKFMDDWNKGGSNIMTQYAEAASAEFDVPLSSYEKNLVKEQKDKNKKEIEKITGKFSPEDAAILLGSRKILPLEDRKKIVREMYEGTQEYFRDNNITEVLAYRGYVSNARNEAASNAKEGQSMQYVANSIESWSLAHGVANSFANTPTSDTGDKITMIFAAKIPVERILSMPETGAGVGKEQEFIVLGNGADAVFIRKKYTEI